MYNASEKNSVANFFNFYIYTVIWQPGRTNIANMLSTRTVIYCILVFSTSFFPLEALLAQDDGESIDTSQYIHEDTQNARNYNLLLAAVDGYDKIIEVLVVQGADINTTSIEGVTPLMYAVINNHPHTVETILSHNPDINKMTYRYETPLMISVKNQNADMAELLIRNGADIDRSDGNGATPLHFAALYGNFTVADLLLYYEADCNRKSADGTTALMVAVWAGNAEIADLLIQNGANPEARDNDGFTPFLIAAQNGDTLLMSMLLRSGVDLYERNVKNFNALDLAIAGDKTDAVAFLLEKGDQWSTTRQEGLNPYRIAYDFNRKDMVRMMERKNVPGKTGNRINEIEISINSKFNLNDIYSGVRVKLKESILNGGIVAGFDLKLWYTRVLMQTPEDVYFQYYNKNSVLYAGIFKEYQVFESSSGLRLSVSGSVSAAWMTGNIFKGTDLKIKNQLKLIPSAEFTIRKESISFFTGVDYMKTKFYKLGSLWGRAGFSISLFADRITSPRKVIKWH